MSKVKAQLTTMAAHDPRIDLADLDRAEDADGVDDEAEQRAI
jgi:hypothetical protein